MKATLGPILDGTALENPMDREAWWATVHRVKKSQMQLSTHAYRGSRHPAKCLSTLLPCHAPAGILGKSLHLPALHFPQVGGIWGVIISTLSTSTECQILQKESRQERTSLFLNKDGAESDKL